MSFSLELKTDAVLGNQAWRTHEIIFNVLSIAILVYLFWQSKMQLSKCIEKTYRNQAKDFKK